MTRRDEQLRGRASRSSEELVGSQAGLVQSFCRTRTKAEVGIPADAEVALLGNCSWCKYPSFIHSGPLLTGNTRFYGCVVQIRFKDGDYNYQNGWEMRQERFEELRWLVSSASLTPTAPPLAPIASAASPAALGGLIATRTCRTDARLTPRATWRIVARVECHARPNPFSSTKCNNGKCECVWKKWESICHLKMIVILDDLESIEDSFYEAYFRLFLLILLLSRALCSYWRLNIYF